MEYFISVDGEAQGPYSVEDLSNLYTAGNINETSMIWYEGLETWANLSELPIYEEIKTAFSAPDIQQDTPAENTENIRIQCPHCGNELLINQNLSGHELTCSQCSGKFRHEIQKQNIPSSFMQQCPYCNNMLQLRTEWLNMDVTCPCCNKSFICSNNIKTDVQSDNIILPDESNDTYQKPAKTFYQKRKTLITVSALILCLIILSFQSWYMYKKYEDKQVKELTKRAKNAKTYKEAFDILETIFSKYPSNRNISEARSLWKTYKEETTPVSSAEAIKKLYFNDSYSLTQIHIKKTINKGNPCFVYAFPIDQKKKIRELTKKLDEASKSANAYVYHLRQDERLNKLAKNAANPTQKLELLYKALEHSKASEKSLINAKNKTYEVTLELNAIDMATLNNFSDKKTRMIEMKNDACTISVVKGPIILFVYEMIKYNGIPFMQYWYTEYKPFDYYEWILK